MDFAFDAETEDLRERLLDFMDSHVYPAEAEYHAVREGAEHWSRPPVLKRLQAEARSRGLWNLFLPHSEHGAGLIEPAVRAAGRDHRPLPRPRAGGAQLLRPGHRQHGGAGPVRLAGAAGAVAAAAAGRADPVRVLHDRAGRRLLRRPQHPAGHPARRRLVCPQWTEVVVDRGDGAGVPDPHRDGGDRPGRRPVPAAVDGAGPAGHPGRHGRPAADGLRVRRRGARRPRRGVLLRCPRPGRERAARRGRGLPDRAGAARPGADPPLHAGDRGGRAGAGAAAAGGRCPGWPSARRWRSRAWCRTGSPRRGSGSSRPGCWS